MVYRSAVELGTAVEAVPPSYRSFDTGRTAQASCFYGLLRRTFTDGNDLFVPQGRTGDARAYRRHQGDVRHRPARAARWPRRCAEGLAGMPDACLRWDRDVRRKSDLEHRSPVRYCRGWA